jgi:hypothetical protein
MDRFTLGFACGACVFAAAVCGIAALALVDLWRDVREPPPSQLDYER